MKCLLLQNLIDVKINEELKKNFNLGKIIKLVDRELIIHYLEVTNNFSTDFQKFENLKLPPFIINYSMDFQNCLILSCSKTYILSVLPNSQLKF